MVRKCDPSEHDTDPEQRDDEAKGSVRSKDPDDEDRQATDHCEYPKKSKDWHCVSRPTLGP